MVLLFLSAMVYSQVFNVPDFSNDKMGTYMPILFIDEFERTNNYLKAMQINNNRYYDVICINKNIVYSNKEFHDQFAIRPDDVNLFAFFENNGIIGLTDKNSYRYIKISDDINYYRAYRMYVNNRFFNILSRYNQNIITKTDDGFIYNKEKWIINLDVFNYPGDDNFVFFHENRNGKYIGIQYIGNKVLFYDLEEGKNKEILLMIP